MAKERKRNRQAVFAFGLEISQRGKEVLSIPALLFARRACSKGSGQMSLPPFDPVCHAPLDTCVCLPVQTDRMKKKKKIYGLLLILFMEGIKKEEEPQFALTWSDGSCEWAIPIKPSCL